MQTNSITPKPNSMQVREMQMSWKTNEKPAIKITSPNAAIDYAHKIYEDYDPSMQEHVFAIVLDRNNNVLGHRHVGSGGVDQCVVDMRLVAQAAILANASAVILLHNHPSGNMNASSADIQLTHKAQDALKLFSIRLLDHIIVGPHGQAMSMNNDGTFKFES